MPKTKRSGSTATLVTLSALAAIGIILGKFLAFNVTEFMRFSLENITIIFSGIVFGPLYGAVVGAVQDLVGCIAVGYAINPLIALGCAVTGAVSGIAFRLFKGAPLSLRLTLALIPAHLFGSVLIKSVGLAIFYSLPLGMTLLWRLLNYVIVGAAEIVLLSILLKSKQLLTQLRKISNFDLGAKFNSAKEVTEYAKNISGVFSKPGLERVTALLRGVGSPEESLKVIHVAGTNGKGSTTAILSSILTASGLKVGSFTSPYLYEMRESIRINTKPISEEDLTSLFESLSPVADAMEDKPTEFELLTAAAYLAFKKNEVDVAIVECGMGGERDATNVIHAPLISLITGVALDHTAHLGDTVGAIAKEKAGIIKAGCPIVVGELSNEALSVIKDRARLLDSPLLSSKNAGTVVKETSLDGTVIDCHGITDIRLSLLGVHQPKNAALAITAALILRDTFPSVTEESIRNGVEAARWQGRFEPILTDPLVIYDGAHNLDGVESAVKSARIYLKDGAICLTGVLADKEYTAMAERIATVAKCAVTVTPDNPRALSADEYADVLKAKGIEAHSAKTIDEGVKLALSIARERSLPILCLGSLYLYKDVKSAMMKNQ